MLHDIFSMKKCFVIFSKNKNVPASMNAMRSKKRVHITMPCTRVEFLRIFSLISIGILCFNALYLPTITMVSNKCNASAQFKNEAVLEDELHPFHRSLFFVLSFSLRANEMM